MALKKEEFNRFILEINKAYQQFCVWMYLNNEFVKHQDGFNNVSKCESCRYKNFFDVVIPSMMHSWILRLSRIFDKPYSPLKQARLSLEYISKELINDYLEELIRAHRSNKKIISSIKKLRDNFLAHNDLKFKIDKKIQGGIEDLFKDLCNIVIEIKNNNSDFKNCDNIDLSYWEELSKNGIDELFFNLKNS